MLHIAITDSMTHLASIPLIDESLYLDISTILVTLYIY